MESQEQRDEWTLNNNVIVRKSYYKARTRLDITDVDQDRRF